MEEEEEPRGTSAEEPHDERREVPGMPTRDPTLVPSPAPLPSAIILRALQQAVGGSLQGELSNEKDVPRARGPRKKRCRSPRADLCLRGAGGTDAAAVVDHAARSFLVGLLGVLEPPDSWMPGRLDLPTVDEEPTEMLELVAEVHLGDGAPLSLPISHPLHGSRAWRLSKSGSLLQPGFLGPTGASSRLPLLTMGTGDGGPAPPPAPSSTSSSPSSSPRSSSSSPPPPPPPPPAPRYDIYDPFHPTDEAYSPPPAPEQKYDPFEPTGSNPSSSGGTPSPGEEEEEEDEEALSHSISRISETLAGIYDDNSLSQDFPSGESPGPEPPPPTGSGSPPQADSTRVEGGPPRRRVFVVGAEAEASRGEGKLSLEVVTTGAPFPPAAPPLDSEIEEGEIVQPEEELRFAPVALFRGSGGRAPRPAPPSASAAAGTPAAPLPPPPARGPEGDDFLSLHAESDGEGALQVDLGDPVPAAPPATSSDPRWTGLDLRRKILTQRRERYRQRSPSPTTAPAAPPQPPRKKSKRDHKREAKDTPAPPALPSPPAPVTWDPKKHRSRDHKPSSRSSRRRSRSRSPRPRSSWSPSSERRRGGRRSRSREKRRRRRRRSSASPPPTSSSSRRERHRTKHRSEGSSKKKKKRSRSRGEKRGGGDPEKVLVSGTERESRRRGAVPPSIQDLTDHDLFSIKRTITVGRAEKPTSRSASVAGSGPAPASPLPKREVLYDSEGLSCEERGGGGGKGSNEKERKRSAALAPREKGRKKAASSEGAERERDKGSKKARPSSGKDTAPKTTSGGSGRKVKLQSKVAVLIREGVSSTTSAKEVAATTAPSSIGVKFSRDRESRSPFLKAEEKASAEPGKGVAPGGPKLKKAKVKAKAGLKKVKGSKVKTKGPKTKKKKAGGSGTGTTLKKSKADSCSQAGPKGAEETSWSGEERAPGKPPSPPTPKVAPPPPALTPDSQTVDSSCKTPDVSFLPEEPARAGGRSRGRGDQEDGDEEEEEEEEEEEQPGTTTASGGGGGAGTGTGGGGSIGTAEAAPEDGPPARAPQPPAPPPMPWNLPGGVDCATSGVLALTALLFKMEEANLASRAKAQELIQATNQILGHAKPPSALGGAQAPGGTVLGLPPGPSGYLLHGGGSMGLPLGGCSSSPPSPGGLAGGPDRREGSSSSDGRMDTDKYLKKLHTQERAVEEVKLAIKPYYQKKDITKEEYKDILRKAVHKICHSKSGEINPVKVSNLVRAYVQRYRYFRKHGRKPGDPSGPSRQSKEPAPPDKCGPVLPVPPL